MAERRRVNVRAILADKDLRRALMVPTIQAIQAREGIETTREQAERAYYVVTEAERAAFFSLRPRGTLSEPNQRHQLFVQALRSNTVGVRFDVARRDFGTVEGAPLMYEGIDIVGPLCRQLPPLGSYAATYQGVTTRDDPRFIRYWWEIVPRKDMKPWVPFAKGGDFARFYSDIDLVIDWSAEAQSLFWRRRDPAIYFKPGLTWPRRTQRGFNVRLLPQGCIFADKGPGLFPNDHADQDFLLGLLNSTFTEYAMRCFASFGSWEMSAVRRLPFPDAASEARSNIAKLARQIANIKERWDEGNEVSSRFTCPWIVRAAEHESVAKSLDALAAEEAHEERQILDSYARINSVTYQVYGIREQERDRIESTLPDVPRETVWPQMEGRDAGQKRMEHIWRLLSFAVKQVLDADDDGIVPFNRSTGETPLAERVRHELAALFPGRDESQLEVEIVNELKRSVKGYRKCASLDDWLANAYFEYHAGLYKSRPIYWHIASAQGTAPLGFGALVHYHRFDRNRMAKLRASYVRDTIEELRRDAGLADKAGRADDRVELQARLEEVQALDKKLRLIQEGHHEGADGGDRDFRILTPWKEPANRPKGWNPDLDDGVKVNIGPLVRAGVLRASGGLG